MCLRSEPRSNCRGWDTRGRIGALLLTRQLTRSDLRRSRFFLGLEQSPKGAIVNSRISRLFLLAAIGFAGCSVTGKQPQSTCELMTASICSRAAATQLKDETLAVSYPLRPEEAHVVPLVVPVVRQDGVLAAEVDCYVDTDSRSYSLVSSNIAIAPTSEESVDFLEARHLCTAHGSYAEDDRQRLATASGNPLSSK